MHDNSIEIHNQKAEPWKITLIDTGDDSQTGGRLKRVKSYLSNEDSFCFTYGDGVSDVDISASILFHKKHKKLVTVTAVQPPGRYGAIISEGNNVTGFYEKPKGDGGYINGGFFVLSPKAIDYIDNDNTSWENEPLSNLAREGQVQAFEHHGFWQPMDTLRDKNLLENLWINNNAKWKIW
jgi:glucose-1-phosphate cytidylyltransferase